MKDAYFFTHDSNARHDPKILEMISVYGMAGYGWYWVIIELLREQEDYRLKINGKYSHTAFAMQMHCDSNTAKKFIDDCINEFELFESDNTYFWSDSLRERMKHLDKRREKAREAANKRWGNELEDEEKCDSNANAMQTQCPSNASKVNKSKVKKIKENNTKEMKSLISHFNQKFGKKYQLTSGIREKIRTRLKNYEYDDLIKAIDIISQIPFYRGKNDRGWVASPKYLFRSDDVVDEVLNKEDEIDTRKLIIEEARDCFKKSKDCKVKIAKDMPEKCKVCYRERVKWKT